MKKVFSLFVCLLTLLLVTETVYAGDNSTKKVKTDTTGGEVVENIESKSDLSSSDNVVKVYIFEAGGCPACETQIKYLEGLATYKEKFIIVKKELYVDHVNWEKGKDFELGVEVVNYFKKHGFPKAGYNSTPLVVVSDLYASNGYNASLESIIDRAYKIGDKDIVSKIINGEEIDKENNTVIYIIIGIILISGIGALIFVAKRNND